MKQRKIFKLSFFIIGLFSWISLSHAFAQTNPQQNIETIKTVISADGTAINYYEYEHEDPTLVFVHGWSCEASYWKEQIEYFKKNYQMIMLDLAGHGQSESKRKNYTMAAFAQDVKAVVDNTQTDKVILIGHSMGALVTAHAALLMPEKVIGLIAVDDLQNVEYPLSKEQFDAMVSPFKENFKQGVRSFVTEMLRPDNLPINEWIISDMSSADPEIAISTINSSLEGYLNGTTAKLFHELSIPVVAVNTNQWPTNVEANKRHIKDFELIELDELDHFLMLKAPERFNPALEKAIKLILKQ